MNNNSLFPIERQEAIVKIVNEKGRIRICDIQSTFLVGYETAKNDLITLEKSHKLRRVHGGAISLASFEQSNKDYNHKSIVDIFLKESGGGKKVYLDNSVSVFLTPEVYLSSNMYFTNSISLAHFLISSGVEVKLTGTEYNKFGFSHELLLSEEIDIGIVCLPYKTNQILSVKSLQERDYYSSIINLCKKVLVLPNIGKTEENAQEGYNIYVKDNTDIIFLD